MARFIRKFAELILYLAMLILIAVCFTGEGLFIYEGF
jgi:hypothetical protein